jgi:hypothetical protein
MGNWNGTPTAYGAQWMRDGAPIAGATRASYLLTAADSGWLVAARSYICPV